MSAVLRSDAVPCREVSAPAGTKNRVHVVSVPRELKEYRQRIGMALFNLALGRAEPVETVTTNLVSVRFALTLRDQAYLDELLAQPEFKNNKRKVFHSALAWLRDQPAHIHRINV